jgi:hypothetical protein
VSTIYPVARAGAHPPIRYRLLVTSGFVALDLGRGRCGFLRTHGKYSARPAVRCVTPACFLLLAPVCLLRDRQ